MTTNNPYLPDGAECLEDLVESYVLGSLEEDEREVFEAHLESCPLCVQAVADFQQAGLALAEAVPQVSAPLGIGARVLESVEELPLIFRPLDGEGVRKKVSDEASTRFTLSTFAMPLAATLVVGLLTASLIMNVVTTSRLNTLQQERVETNSRLEQLEAGLASASTGVSQLAIEGQQTDSALKQVMETSYLMARPFTQPLLLSPTDGNSESEGVLLVTSDGRKAILMLANMEPPQPSQAFNVWLSRNGQHLAVGQISVDSSGWGTMALDPPESLYGFDWMNLTVDKPQTGAGSGEEMVLQTRILSPGDR